MDFRRMLPRSVFEAVIVPDVSCVLSGLEGDHTIGKRMMNSRKQTTEPAMTLVCHVLKGFSKTQNRLQHSLQRYGLLG